MSEMVTVPTGGIGLAGGAAPTGTAGAVDASREVVEGYLARPVSGTGPAVLVAHGAWGLVGQIRSVADRLAEQGFVAFAPDLFHGARAAVPAEKEPLSTGLVPERAARDLTAAVRYLAHDVAGVTSGGRIGAVGFGFGGLLALWAATLGDPDAPADGGAGITAVSSFYPRLAWERVEPDWTRMTGRAVLLHCAAEDGGATAPPVLAARTAIEAAGGQVTAYDYPDTRHGFFNDDHPDVYHRDASARAWARTLELFRTRLP